MSTEIMESTVADDQVRGFQRAVMTLQDFASGSTIHPIPVVQQCAAQVLQALDETVSAIHRQQAAAHGLLLELGDLTVTGSGARMEEFGRAVRELRNAVGG